MTGPEESVPDNPRVVKARLFLSYSRKDITFAQQLLDALILRGYDARLDLNDISPGEKWQPRLEALIIAADVIVFLASPDSLQSAVCRWELGRATDLSKRLIPIVARAVHGIQDLPELSELNFLFFDAAHHPAVVPECVFDAALTQLTEAIDVDIAWIREHTRLTELAERWHSHARTEGNLIYGLEVTAAEQWAALPSPPNQRITNTVRDFIRASREREDTDNQRRRRVIGRAFIEPAANAVANRQFDRAIRLVAAGVVLARDPDFELIPELWGVAAQAVHNSRLRGLFVAGDGPLQSVAFDSGGRRLIAASPDRWTSLWDLETGQVITRFQSPLPTLDARLTPDESKVITVHRHMGRMRDEYIATLGSDTISLLWSVDPVACISIATFQSEANRIRAISPDGSHALVLRSAGSVEICDCATGLRLATLAQDIGDVGSAIFSPDGSTLVTGLRDYTSGANRQLTVWDANTGAALLVISDHADSVRRVQFSDGGRYLLATSLDHLVRLYDVTRNGEPVYVRPAEGTYNQLGYLSADGRRVATHSDSSNDVQIWDPVHPDVRTVLQGHQGRITCLSFSPTGALVATGSEDCTARLWDTATGECVEEFRGHSRPLTSVRFTPDGRHFGSASSDHSARLWDACCSHEVAVLRADDVMCDAAFSLTSEHIFTAAVNGLVQKWDLNGEPRETGSHRQDSMVRAIGVTRHADSVITVAADQDIRIWQPSTGSLVETRSLGDGIADICPFGRFAATVSEHGAARVYRMDDRSMLFGIGEEEEAAAIRDAARMGLRIMGMEGHEVRDASFSPDGQSLATFHADCSIRIWGISAGALLATLDSGSGQVVSHYSGSFSDDGHRIVSTMSEVWDLETGARLCVLDGRHPVSGVGRVRPIDEPTFASDGQRIIGSDDGWKIWSAETGRLMVTLADDSSKVTRARFSHDGRSVFTSSSDGVAALWDSASGKRVLLLKGWKNERTYVPSNFARMSYDDRWMATSAVDGTIRLWNVERHARSASTKGAALLAGLAKGMGTLSPSESQEIMLNEAPTDLFGALRDISRVSTDALRQASDSFFATSHPNCYLSPSEYSRRYGLE
jgi:WD40 repeat protein